jgi:hypothetical protein
MPEKNGVMTVEEAEKRFAGKWLALEVVSRDSDGSPHEVCFIEEAETEREVLEKTRSFDDIFILFAGPVVPPGWEFVFAFRDLPTY